MLHAYQAHADIFQKDGEELIDYNDRYIESTRAVAESEFPALTDQIEAIKFVESLNPKLFLEWQNQPTNKESRVSHTGATKAQTIFKIDDHIVSTINAARQPDSEGRGRGTCDPKKTHASKPRVHQDEYVDREEEADEVGPKRECKICDGVLN